MIAVTWPQVEAEAVGWLVPAVLMGTVWLIRQAGRLVRKIDAIGVDLAEVKKVTKHHLGPNGDTPPIHSRLRAIEAAHDLEVGP